MGKILLVDDDEDIRQLVILRLEIAEHDIDFAVNGKVGFDIAMENNYDLILMDMHMPVMDGYDAIQQLRRFGYEGKIVGLTASAMMNETQKALSSGCDDVIVKPITEDFEIRISQYIDSQYF